MMEEVTIPLPLRLVASLLATGLAWAVTLISTYLLLPTFGLSRQDSLFLLSWTGGVTAFAWLIVALPFAVLQYQWLISGSAVKAVGTLGGLGLLVLLGLSALMEMIALQVLAIMGGIAFSIASLAALLYRALLLAWLARRAA